MADTTPTKRAASATPDGRPTKRLAPSSPEEGELDSDAAASPPPATQVADTPPPPKPAEQASTSKVAFPFKRKATAPAPPAPPDVKDARGPAVYERPEELDRKIREETLSHASYPGRRREYERERERAPRGGDRYMPNEPYYAPPPRERSRAAAWGDSHWDRSYSAYQDPYYDRRDQYDYPPPAPHHGGDRWVPARDYDRRDRDDERAYHDRPRSPTRSPPRSPARSPVRSESRTSESPVTTRAEKHRLPVPASPVLSVPDDARLRSPARSITRPRSRERERERGWERGGRDESYHDSYRPAWGDDRGHYHREVEDYHYRPRGYDEYDYYDRYRGREADDWYGRDRRYDGGQYRDHYRPPLADDAPLSDTRKPATPIPPPPASMDPRLSPPSQLEAAPPLPPPLLDRRKDDTIPVEHAPVTIAMPNRPRREDLQSTDAGREEKEAVTEEKESEEVKAPGPVKAKRVPVQRTREQEKEAYGRVFMGCGKQNDYELMSKLGEGTFGEVHKAIHKQTGTHVALKRILMHNEKEGMPVTALREIKILKALNHPCIVNILDMFVVRSTKDSPLSVYMVFPYMDHDLAGLLENERVKLTPSQIKLYMKQLLEGTEYMHRNHILHRDMKAANLLISNAGQLRIADFGLARAFDPAVADRPADRHGRERKYTNCVVTRWYRPPELLLGARQYGGEVDMWGVGCVLGEMFMRKPILPGSSDLDQLDRIWQLCGTPNQHTWPNFDALPGCEGVKRFQFHGRKVKGLSDMIGMETADLLDKLLTVNPANRITAAQALDHEYFWSDPLPADPKTLPHYEASHELDKRVRRQGQMPPQPPPELAMMAGGGPPPPVRGPYPPPPAYPQQQQQGPPRFQNRPPPGGPPPGGPPPPQERFGRGPPPPTQGYGGAQPGWGGQPWGGGGGGQGGQGGQGGWNASFPPHGQQGGGYGRRPPLGKGGSYGGPPPPGGGGGGLNYG